MAENRPLRVGFVGCGRVTTDLHLPGLTRVPGLAAVALADPDAQKLESAGRAWGVHRLYPTAEELANDPTVDLVAVCSPPGTHADVAIAALDAGRHLLIEKPLALTLDDVDRIARHPRNGDRIVAVGFNLRHHRQVRLAQRVIQSGRLGAVQFLRTQLTSNDRLLPTYPRWQRFRQSGGGALWELAVHHVDLWRLLLGDQVFEVAAFGRDDPCEDDVVTVTARTARGTVISGTFAQATPDSNELQIAGDRASLRLAFYRGDGVRFTHVGAPRSSVGVRAREVVQGALDLPRQALVARRGGDYVATRAAGWASLAQSVAAGRPPVAGLVDGREAIKLILAIGRAAADARVVRLSEFEA